MKTTIKRQREISDPFGGRINHVEKTHRIFAVAASRLDLVDRVEHERQARQTRSTPKKKKCTGQARVSTHPHTQHTRRPELNWGRRIERAKDIYQVYAYTQHEFRKENIDNNSTNNNDNDNDNNNNKKQQQQLKAAAASSGSSNSNKQGRQQQQQQLHIALLLLQQQQQRQQQAAKKTSATTTQRETAKKAAAAWGTDARAGESKIYILKRGSRGPGGGKENTQQLLCSGFSRVCRAIERAQKYTTTSSSPSSRPTEREGGRKTTSIYLPVSDLCPACCCVCHVAWIQDD